MRNPAVPFALLAAVAAATFGLAKWHPFSPDTPAPAAIAGDATRGETVYGTTCASCHGADATGGVGPPLAGSRLTAADVASVVAAGRGVMPPRLVQGQAAADVAAYVASIAE